MSFKDFSTAQKHEPGKAKPGDKPKAAPKGDPAVAKSDKPSGDKVAVKA